MMIGLFFLKNSKNLKNHDFLKVSLCFIKADAIFYVTFDQILIT